VKEVGAARNGTAGSPVCVPNGAPSTPITLDDVQEYNDCSSKAAGSSSCRNTTQRFEKDTGCGQSCQVDLLQWIDRVTLFCSHITDEEKCTATKAPCAVPASPAGATSSAAPTSARNAPRRTPTGEKGAESQSPGPLIGPIAGATLLALSVLIVLVLVLRRAARARRGSKATA
jgi:hypothetical protein